MAEYLSQLFAEAQAAQVDWEGAPLYGLYEMTPAPESMTVEFLKAATAPVQGLNLKAEGGNLVANDVEVPKGLYVWRDTAPDIVQVTAKPKHGKQVKLKIWNIWRRPISPGVEITDAWQGNSGMRVEPSSDGKVLLFRCSDGIGPIDFDNLVVRLTLG